MKHSLKLFVLAWFVFLTASPSGPAQTPPSQPALTDFRRLKEEDIVFIESNSERAPAIKALTGSNLTHWGVVFRDKKQKWIVINAVSWRFPPVEVFDSTELGPVTDASPSPSLTPQP